MPYPVIISFSLSTPRAAGLSKDLRAVGTSVVRNNHFEGHVRFLEGNLCAEDAGLNSRCLFQKWHDNGDSNTCRRGAHRFNRG